MSRIGANYAFYALLTLFGLGIFLLFSLLNKIAPLTISHTIYFCQQTLNSLMFTLPHSLPPLFVLILFSVVLTGFLLLTIQLVKTRLFVKKILKNRIPNPRKIKNIAQGLSIINKIDVVKDQTYTSFCYGLINPRICISVHLIKKLSDEELKAVLIHESYHLENRDPFKILLSQVATSMFFFVPTIRDIQKYYTLSKEISADQLVVKTNGLKSLRMALLKIISNPQPTYLGVASIASSDDLEKRIRILTFKETAVIKISAIKLLLSSLVLLTALILLNMPVYAIENGEDSHSYFMCPFGGECVLSCKKEGIRNEIPFSDQNSYSPINYSINQ